MYDHFNHHFQGFMRLAVVRGYGTYFYWLDALPNT